MSGTKHELTLTAVTLGIGTPDSVTGVRTATIGLYDGDAPLHVSIERPIPPVFSDRSKVGDRWTVSLTREVAL